MLIDGQSGGGGGSGGNNARRAFALMVCAGIGEAAITHHKVHRSIIDVGRAKEGDARKAAFAKAVQHELHNMIAVMTVMSIGDDIKNGNDEAASSILSLIGDAKKALGFTDEEIAWMDEQGMKDIGQ